MGIYKNIFSFKGSVPLDLSVFLGRKGNPRSEQGFSFLPKTHLPFLALLRAAALRTCMGFGVFDRLKPVDCSFAENISCRLSAAPPNNLCKFAGGKLGADSKQIYVRKTDSSCPHFLALLRGEPLRTPSGSTEMGFCLQSFYASLHSANLERTVDQVVAVRPIHPVRRGR